MPYQAVVIRIMLSSPGDVADTRDIARAVIEDWNAAHSFERGLYLAPVDWKTHAAPEMGDRPQEIINRQILRDCDLLIAVFGTRLGSPTGVAISGTVEEIEEHLNAGKPAMVYFSNAPVPPDRVDEMQLRAVRSFKESCRLRGLVETFDSPVQFREKMSRHLATVVNRYFRGVSPSGVDEGGLASLGFPQLGETAASLLSMAAEAEDGRVVFALSMGGFIVQVNGRQLAEKQDARSQARWKSAIQELVDHGFLEPLGERGEIFAVTDRGFQCAERSRGV